MPWHPQQAVAVKGVARSKNVGWTDGERTVFYPDPKHWGRIKTAGGIDRRQRDRDAEGVEGVGNGEGWGGGYPIPSRLGGLGERRELPQRGPGRKRICCTLELSESH